MLVVKVELWPLGNESGSREIARAFITNDAKTTRETKGAYGSYDARFMQSIQFDPKKVWKTGRAERVHRRRRGVWDILYQCLKSAGMEARIERAAQSEEGEAR